jgi:hypothetical protein
VQFGAGSRFAPVAAEVKAITAMSAMSRQATRRNCGPQSLMAMRMATADRKRHGPLGSCSRMTSPIRRGSGSNPSEQEWSRMCASHGRSGREFGLPRRARGAATETFEEPLPGEF